MKSHAAVGRRQGEHARSLLTVAASSEVYAGLERLKHLEEQFARAAVNGREHRRLAAAIRIEAVAYRKSLDTDQAAAMHHLVGYRKSLEPDQAAAMHDPKLRSVVRSRSLLRTSAAGKPTSVR